MSREIVPSKPCIDLKSCRKIYSSVDNLYAWVYPLIVQTPYMVHISKIIFYQKSIKYPFFIILTSEMDSTVTEICPSRRVGHFKAP